MEQRHGKRLIGFLAFCAALGGACNSSSLSAIEIKKPEDRIAIWAKMSDTDLASAYKKAVDDGEGDNCHQLAPMLTELVKRKLGAQYPKAKAEADLDCAVNQKRWKTAFQLMAPYEALLEKEETIGSYGVLIARSAKQHSDAAVRIAWLAKAKDSEELLEIEDQALAELSRDLKLAKLDEARRSLFRSLVDSAHFSELSAASRVLTSLEVLENEARNLSPDAVNALLANIVDPTDYLKLLASKRFEPLWPIIEAHVGPNMKAATDRFIVSAASAYKNNRSSGAHRNTLAEAFLFAGRYENVIALAKTIPHDPRVAFALSENDGWVLNIEGYALDAMQRRAEADKVFDLLEKLNGGILQNMPGSIAANLALRLAEVGRWPAALVAARSAEKIARQNGTDYAKLLILQVKVCALSRLNRVDEAAAILADVETRRKASPSVAATSMLCAGRDDKAAQFVIEGLGDPSAADGVLDDLQGEDFVFYDTRKHLPSLRQRLRHRPDVAAAFDAIGRDIPKAFIPLQALRRAAFSPTSVK